MWLNVNVEPIRLERCTNIKSDWSVTVRNVSKVKTWTTIYQFENDWWYFCFYLFLFMLVVLFFCLNFSVFFFTSELLCLDLFCFFRQWFMLRNMYINLHNMYIYSACINFLTGWHILLLLQLLLFLFEDKLENWEVQFFYPYLKWKELFW